jgi:ubiquinone biosynthesis protein
LAVWAEHGITPARVARRLLRSVLMQTMRHRFFHGDPHPANLIVRPDGSLAWVDFGMTGWMDDRTWIQQFRLRDAIARKDLHRAYESLLDTLEPIPRVDLRGFEQTIEGVMQDWLVASETPGASLVEKSSGFFLIRTFEAIRRAGMTMPTRLMRLYRTMIIADMVMLKLDPTINWVPILRRFVEAETRRQARDLRSSPLLPGFVETLQAFLRIPAASIRLIDWLNGRLPRYGRLFERQMSVFEASAFAAIRLGRGLALIALFGVIAVEVIGALGGAVDIRPALRAWRVPLALGAVAVYLWASLALRSFRR